MMNNFVAFILSHGRPNNVLTYNALRKSGYTGKIVIVIDNEDSEAETYKKIYKNEVVMFDKLKISKTFDEADNFDDRRAIVYARNACFEIAEKINVKYFIELDDDYTQFRYTQNSKKEYITNKNVNDLDSIFKILLTFYKNTNIHSIALAQGGDFIGGENSKVFKEKLSRKCMNSFICSTERPFKFIGRINEDVNTYTRMASIGHLFFTTSLIRLEQKATQESSGGMTDIYLENGTYIKSFYSVIFQPSSVKIRLMGVGNKRLHHSVSWNNTVPKIINEKYKKVVNVIG